MNNNAAKAAQTNGATMNTQTELNAQDWNKAGPKLLAGFTEVPVNPNHNRWTNVKDNQITNQATEAFSDLWVAQSTAKTNTKVNITSANNPNQTFPQTQSSPLAHKASKDHNKTQRTKAQRIPHMNWATTYLQNSLPFIHQVIQTQRLTAGFTWHHETGPIA